MYSKDNKSKVLLTNLFVLLATKKRQETAGLNRLGKTAPKEHHGRNINKLHTSCFATEYCNPEKRVRQTFIATRFLIKKTIQRVETIEK